MRVAFYKGAEFNPVEEIIRLRSNSPFCHVELLFSNGQTFSSVAYTGTRFTDGKQVKSPDWTVVDLGTLDENKIRTFCEANNGKGYDYLGCAAFLVGADDPDGKNRFFCSMVCVAALQAAGIFKFAKPSATSPGELFLMASAFAEARSRFSR